MIEHTTFLITVIRKAGVNNFADVEDVLQNTFLKAIIYKDKYSENGKLRNWLGIIARNEAYRFLQKPQMLQLDETLLDFYEDEEIDD